MNIKTNLVDPPSIYNREDDTRWTLGNDLIHIHQHEEGQAEIGTDGTPKNRLFPKQYLHEFRKP